MIYGRSKDKVRRLYLDDKKPMREIAAMYGVSHAMMRRYLLRWGIPARNKVDAAKNRPEYTPEQRLARSLKMKAGWAKRKLRGHVPYNKGSKASIELCLKNMKGRMRSNIDFSVYANYERLKFLTYYLSKHKESLGSSDVDKKRFLDTFYFDEQFILIYNKWVSSGRSKWWRPSIDHMVPKSKGGKTVMSNLQFLTWFENRAKAEMTEQEWSVFKAETQTRSKLFLRRQ